MGVVLTDKRSDVFLIKDLECGDTFHYSGKVYVLCKSDGVWYKALDITGVISSPDSPKNYQNFTGSCPVEVVEVEVSFR